MTKFEPKIGKNVIETLTLGMYEDARFIYREYVQNAADQIDVAIEEGILNKKDEGRINITIDKKQKSIIIEDNATGIESSNIRKFLANVADSQKDRTKRKGFRGIGRLGGLGYCEQLIFETSYEGESKKSIITMNAKMLEALIENKSYEGDAATVISVITNFEEKKVEAEERFFKVILKNVTNDDLLDSEKVKNYLSMVAPIPYAEDFLFKDKIHRYFKKNNVTIEEYEVRLTLNDDKLYKAYKPNIFDKNGQPIYQILDVDFFKIKNEDDELIALAWYGISEYMNKRMHQNNIELGFRLRKNNIQIGSLNTLNKFFKEHRFNHHFIGEIHVIGDSFVPNARRDYFKDNKIVQELEETLESKFKEFSRYAHDVSKIHNRLKDIQEFQEFEIPKKIRSKKEEKKYQEEFTYKKEQAIFAQKELEKLYKKSETVQTIDVVLEHVIGEADLSIDNEEKTIKKATKPPILRKLNFQERKLIMEIFGIIEEELDIERAEKLKEKIIQRYT